MSKKPEGFSPVSAYRTAYQTAYRTAYQTAYQTCHFHATYQVQSVDDKCDKSDFRFARGQIAERYSVEDLENHKSRTNRGELKKQMLAKARESSSKSITLFGKEGKEQCEQENNLENNVTFAPCA